MLKKLSNRISSLIKCSSSDKKDKIEENKQIPSTHTVDLLIDIDWDDINNGMPSSETNSIICHSFRKNGMIGTATPCKMVLENGDVYVPEQLSDHWEAYIGSPKIKPKTIKYINVTNI